LKDGLELLQNLLLTLKDILMFLIRKKINQLSQSKLLEIKLPMKKPKSLEKTMMEFSEKNT